MVSCFGMSQNLFDAYFLMIRLVICVLRRKSTEVKGPLISRIHSFNMIYAVRFHPDDLVDVASVFLHCTYSCSPLSKLYSLERSYAQPILKERVVMLHLLRVVST